VANTGVPVIWEKTSLTEDRSLDVLRENIEEVVAVYLADTAEPVTILTLSEGKLANATASTTPKHAPSRLCSPTTSSGFPLLLSYVS